MTRVALYMRCSTDEQAIEGLSIEGQRSVLRLYCKAKELEIVDEYVDEGRSGRSADRPEFQRMVATAKRKDRPWDGVLVIKWDRFARSLEDAAVYKSLLRNRCGVDILAVQQPSDDTAIGRMVEGIMDVLAEFYSANLAEDTHRGMHEKAKSGRGNLGQPPLGYTLVDDVWQIDEDEAAIVRWIYDSYCDGMGVPTIAQHLREPEAVIQFGDAVRRRTWGPTTIRWMLKNPAYKGTRVWNRSRVVYIDDTIRHRPRPESHHVVVDDAHPAIISTRQWEHVQRLIVARAGGDRRAANDYLLRGFLRCGDCGGPMCAITQRHVRRRKTRPPHNYTWHGVVCSRYVHTRQCARQGIAYDKIEAMVLDAIRDAADDPRDLTFAPPDTCRGISPKRLETKIRDIPVRIDRQVRAYEAGIISLDELKFARNRLRAEEEGLRTQLAHIQAERAQRPDMQTFTARLDEALQMVLSDAPLHVRRKALLGVISHITWSKTQQRLEIMWRRP